MSQKNEITKDMFKFLETNGNELQQKEPAREKLIVEESSSRKAMS